MARARTRTGRRTYRRRTMRRPAFRKRKFFRKRQTYDGVNRVKLVQTDILYYLTATGNAHHTAQWGSRTGAMMNSFSRVSDTDEWISLCSGYREYKIVGMKVRYDPIGNLTSSLGSYFIRGMYATSVGELHDSATQTKYLEESVAYKAFDPCKPFQRYVRCGKYFASQDQKWLPTATAYKLAASNIRITASGYANQAQIGTITTTWYVKLRQWAV